MRDQKTETGRTTHRSAGSYCDFALFEADGICRVIAVHCKRSKMQPGTDFFSEAGIQGNEAQFALHSLLDLREHYVLVRSEIGPILLSDYFYLSVRLICAWIPRVKADSAARVCHNCFPEIVLSPSFSGLDMEPIAGDEGTYAVLQHIRSCFADGFPRTCVSESCLAQDVIRRIYHSTQVLSELVGSRFHMTYPQTKQDYQIRYDPVIGMLCLLVYFCYVDRIMESSDIHLSVLPSAGVVRMELSKNIPDPEPMIPELAELRDLERYCRQTLDFVRVGQRVTLRLFLAPPDDPDLLGFKCYSLEDRQQKHVLIFDLTVADS